MSVGASEVVAPGVGVPVGVGVGLAVPPPEPPEPPGFTVTGGSTNEIVKVPFAFIKSSNV